MFAENLEDIWMRCVNCYFNINRVSHKFVEPFAAGSWEAFLDVFVAGSVGGFAGGGVSSGY